MCSAVPHVRGSRILSLWVEPGGKTLYVVDSASETVLKVNTDTGRSVVLTRFQPDECPGAAGPEFVDNVPTAIDSGFLASFLTATTYPQGRSSVRMWKPDDGAWSRPSTVLDGLTMTNDMVCSRRDGVFRLITVEYSLDPANRNLPSDRIQMFEGVGRRVLRQASAAGQYRAGSVGRRSLLRHPSRHDLPAASSVTG